MFAKKLTALVMSIVMLMSMAVFASAEGSTAEITLPDKELENKKIVVYAINATWLDETRSKTGVPGVIELMEQEYGAEFEVVDFGGDWGKQYEVLTSLYMSDQMPDLLMNANFPTDLANGFVQPLDDLIDFTNPMWDDVRDIMDYITWNGKTYFTVNTPFTYPDWFYYNPQIFDANGLETPAEAYAKGEWDWNKVLELAQELTQDLDGDSQIDQWGLGIAGGAVGMHMQTGVSLISTAEDGTLQLNLRDPKIEAAANLYREFGPAGSNVLLKDGGEISQDYVVEQFAAGNVAMLMTGWWRSQQPGLAPNWQNGKLAVIHLPKWPGEEAAYRGGQIGSMGVGANCQNPEGAALFLEVLKYTTTDAYQEKYNVGGDSYSTWRDVYGLNEEQIEALREIDSYAGPQVPNLFWIFWGWDDGFDSALTAPWSQVLERLEPIAQNSIDDWMAKLSQIE